MSFIAIFTTIKELFSGKIANYLPEILGGLLVLGVVFYIVHTISVRDDQINALTQSVNTLTVEKVGLETSNKAFEKTLANYQKVNALMLDELTQAHAADSEIRDRLSKIETKIDDAQRQKTLTTARNGRHAEWLLSIINKSTACQIEHFNQAGTCVSGKFTPAPSKKPEGVK